MDNQDNLSDRQEKNNSSADVYSNVTQLYGQNNKQSSNESTDNVVSINNSEQVVQNTQNSQKEKSDSSSDLVKLNLNIMSRIYVLTCPKNEAELFNVAAEKLKAKLLELSSLAPNFNNEQLAVLAALDFCHDLEKNDLKIKEIDRILEVRTEEIKSELKELLSE